MFHFLIVCTNVRLIKMQILYLKGFKVNMSWLLLAGSKNIPLTSKHN